MKSQVVLDDAVRSAQALERAELSAELLAALGSVVPFDMACWGLLDPATLETNQEIAAALSISAWTVRDHLKAVFAKTGVRARRELAIKLFTPPALRGSRLT